MDGNVSTLQRDGFSVAALVAFVARVLDDIDPALLPDGFSLGDLRDTRTSIARQKRRLAEHAWRGGGAAPLLEVGQRLEAVAAHPGIAVLLEPADADALRERWMRMERYHRSTCRTVIAVEAESAWRCEHLSDGTPPTLPESLLLCGILAGLLRLIGAEGVDFSFGADGPDRAALLDGATIAEADSHRFVIRWRRMGAAEADAALTAKTPDASGAGAADMASRLLALLATDVSRGWTLADAAGRLCVSGRALQRALAADGRTFSTMLREARVEAAARLLRETDLTLAIVGFRAGFTDQPHFQREFVRVLDVTPADYRRVARTGSSG